jgi:hypothetical protein
MNSSLWYNGISWEYPGDFKKDEEWTVYQFDPNGFIPETHKNFPLQWMGGMNQPVYGDIMGDRTKNAIWLNQPLFWGYKISHFFMIYCLGYQQV